MRRSLIHRISRVAEMQSESPRRRHKLTSPDEGTSLPPDIWQLGELPPGELQENLISHRGRVRSCCRTLRNKCLAVIIYYSVSHVQMHLNASRSSRCCRDQDVKRSAVMRTERIRVPEGQQPSFFFATYQQNYDAARAGEQTATAARNYA